MERHDCIIIGGGPAGLAAGIYVTRDGIDCVLLERNVPGGQTLLTREIANYPGYPVPVSGAELTQKLMEQAESFGLRVKNEEVRGLKVRDPGIHLQCGKSEYSTHAVIVATGASHRKLEVPGEDRLCGRGVSYCGSCDGPFFRNKDVVVVGGGDTAAEEALLLARYAKNVTMVHRRDELRACDYYKKNIAAEKKINIIWNSIVREITGKEKVEGVELEDRQTGERRSLRCEGVFIFVGTMPNVRFLIGEAKLNEYGQVVTDLAMRSSACGVYAVGDVRAESVRQIASAVGDGVTAGIYAIRYLDRLKRDGFFSSLKSY